MTSRKLTEPFGSEPIRGRGTQALARKDPSVMANRSTWSHTAVSPHQGHIIASEWIQGIELDSLRNVSENRLSIFNQGDTDFSGYWRLQTQ